MTSRRPLAGSQVEDRPPDRPAPAADLPAAGLSRGDGGGHEGAGVDGDGERGGQQLDEEAADPERHELGRRAVMASAALASTSRRARRSSAGRRCRPSRRRSSGSPPARRPPAAASTSDAQAEGDRIEASRAARPRSAQMRTGRRRSRSTQAPATRPTSRVAPRLNAAQDGNLTAPGSEHQDRPGQHARKQRCAKAPDRQVAHDRRSIRAGSGRQQLRTWGTIPLPRLRQNSAHTTGSAESPRQFRDAGPALRTMFGTLGEHSCAALNNLTGRQAGSQLRPASTPRCARSASRCSKTDVNFKIVKDFVGKVREARHQSPDPQNPCRPAQQIVKIVND